MPPTAKGCAPGWTDRCRGHWTRRRSAQLCPRLDRQMTASVGGGIAMNKAEFDAARRTNYGVLHAVSCRALGVPESTFCEQCSQQPTPTQKRRAGLDTSAKACFVASRSDRRHLTAELAAAVVNMAVAVRGGDITGVIFHTDKGSRHTSDVSRQVCKASRSGAINRTRRVSVGQRRGLSADALHERGESLLSRRCPTCYRRAGAALQTLADHRRLHGLFRDR